MFIILQFISDLSSFHIQVEHIIPLISRFKSKQTDIEKIFKIKEDETIWDKYNIVILNMLNINIEMKKTVPLLMARCIYNSHKKTNKNRKEKSLSIIIDEAHNILSRESFREKDDWKDYRLETFEEIIKEGRKFGVFVTISSQRPNDISETIISQAHNYFIHQLINQNDLKTIGNAVSYIDKVTEESIPTLPVGTCIFSGIATPMPLKIKINELDDDLKPQSHTLKFADVAGEESIVYL
jgi:DNA helicase HerA-like ATPase